MNFSFRLRWLASLLIISVIALSSVYWWRMSLNHDQLRAYTIDQAGKRASQLAELQAHHMEALFLGIDLALRQFRDAHQTGKNSGAEAISRISQSSFPQGSLTGFIAADANGYITYFNIVNATPKGNTAYHSMTSSKRYYVKDRDYFKFHRKSSKDQLFIGKPIQGRASGIWSVTVSRPIFEKKHFAGVVIASLSIDYLATMLGNMTLGHDDVSILLYNDGAFMARSHDFQNTLGKSVPQDRPFLRPEAATEGVYRAAGATDQVPRIFAWHKLEEYSLLAIIGLDEKAILAPIEQQISHDRKRSALSIGLVLILTTIISVLLMRAARQQNQLKKHVLDLDRMAHYDVLTGTPNRRLLSDRLEQAIARARRGRKLVAVCCLDLDGFKAVNDEHGHAVGDKLLIALSERMKAAIREVDTLARIGGDEFVVVLVDLEKPADCEPVLARLLQAAAEPITVCNTVLQVSASIGVTLYPYDGEEPDQLLRHADQGLYLAKQAGKDRYHLFSLDHRENKIFS